MDLPPYVWVRGPGELGRTGLAQEPRGYGENLHPCVLGETFTYKAIMKATGCRLGHQTDEVLSAKRQQWQPRGSAWSPPQTDHFHTE